ncbi:DUF6457 domain-containing protein [Nitriliruptor alkaliphilus]|uniref:DUF6457 domain-containing protein n=1 Tax=Nitriliruptor alkaliphilus TaxID=427918 RepID=UPI000698CAD0|nr:DUF6457 domain-containing protein [Nitriliruptor alkaliphilus]
MEPDTWFTQLLAALEPTADGSPSLEPVSDVEREALLDLARIAAHTSERWTAPVSTFLVGVRYAAAPAEERAAAVRALVATLDDPDTA